MLGIPDISIGGFAGGGTAGSANFKEYTITAAFTAGVMQVVTHNQNLSPAQIAIYDNVNKEYPTGFIINIIDANSFQLTTAYNTVGSQLIAQITGTTP